MAKNEINLHAKAEQLLENIKVAESLQDFELMIANLNSIKDILNLDTSQLGKAQVVEIPDFVRSKLARAMHRLSFDIQAEQTRRNEITSLGYDYDVYKYSLKQYDDMQTEFSPRLKQMPNKDSFVYDASFLSLNDEEIFSMYDPETALLIDYFNDFADAFSSLGLSKNDLVGKSFADLNKIAAEKGKEMDTLAFKIDKANGVYNVKLVIEDKKQIDEYAKNKAMQEKLRTDYHNLYEDMFTGKSVDLVKVLNKEISSAKNSTTKQQLEDIKKGRDFFKNHSDKLEFIKGDIYAIDNTLIPAELKSKLIDIKKNITNGTASPEEMDLSSHIDTLLNFLDSDSKLKTKSPALYKRINQESYPPQGKRALEKRIEELEKISSGRKLTINQSQELNLLKGILDSKQYTLLPPPDVELKSLYEKYEIDLSKPVSVLQKEVTNISKLEYEANAIDTTPFGEYSASNIVYTVNTPHLTLDAPVQRIGSPYNVKGKDLSDFVSELSQTEAYTPVTGKESFVYAKPVYAQNRFGKPTKKLEKVEIVEESIASIAEQPIQAYNEAIKEYNQKLRSLGMDTLTSQEKKAMKNNFLQLISNGGGIGGFNPDYAGNMDEAIKRIISLKSCNTRTELLRAKEEHSTAYDPFNHFDPNLNNTVTYPGSAENYGAPKVVAKRILPINAFYKYIETSIEPTEFAHEATPPRMQSNHIRKTFGDEKLSKNTTITREQMQQEAQRRAQEEREAMRRKAMSRRTGHDNMDEI